MKYYILYLLFFLLLILTTNQTTLKLMTFNIHFGNTIDNKYNIEELANFILESKAEIICLQEVDNHFSPRSYYEDTLKILSIITGYFYYFCPIYDIPSKRSYQYPNEQFGVGFLSKYEIIKKENFYISRWSTQEGDPQPGSPDFPPKKGGFGHILVKKDDKIISVYNTHLDFRPNPPEGFKKTMREIQVMEMMEIIKFEEYPVILMGDMNTDTSDNKIFDIYFKYFDDAWMLSGKEEKSGMSYPCDEPNIRIDYILLEKGKIIVNDANVLSTRVSDHLPVIVDVEI